jgi:hypothetical protein
MKPQNHSSSFLANVLPLLALPLLALPLAVFGDPVELSDTPISSAASTQVRPNILFVMDDSLSMELDYLPDWAGGGKPSWATPSEVRPDYPRRLYQTRNPDFNGVTYDPAVTYVSPKYFNASGLADTASYPDQDRAQTNGWTAVKNDGYDVQYPSAMNLMDLNGLAFYYTTVPGEYCTNSTLRTCIAATAPTTSGGVEYSVPAKLRWCKYNYGAAQTAPNGDCKAIEVDATKNAAGTSYSDTGYTWARMPRPRIGVIRFSGSSSGSVGSVKVNFKGDDGVVRATEILSGPTAATTSYLTQAQQVADEINKCSFSLPAVTNCQMVGFRAEAMQYSSYGLVYILAPRDPSPGVSVAPAVTWSSGTMATATYAFSTATSYVYASSSSPVDLFYQGYTTSSTSYAVPGDNVLTVITPSVNRYAKAASRSDCVGETCTYDEEMTNFANWWAYYRTRMQAMKTAASRSFEPIDERFRIGYYSINNNTSSDFRNIAEFDGAQKHEWYRKLFAATPYRTDTAMADTPLRVALSQAGYLFAGKLEKMNDVDVVDPMQHSCQTNVTILSTDGYWNQGKGYKLDGTDVGEQDGYVDGTPLEVRPMLDGGIPILQKYTIQRKIQLTPKDAIWNQIKTTQWQVQENVRQQIHEKIEYHHTSQLQKKQAQWQEQNWQLQIDRRNVYYYYPATSTTSWEWRSRKIQLEKASGPVQKMEGHLQKSTKTQRMRKNYQLQSQTAQMQHRTRQLQRRYTWVQQRTSDNGGITWTGWANVDSCTPVASGNGRVDCKTLPAGGYEDVTSGSCTKNAGLTVTSNAGTDNATTTYNTKVECQYTNPGYTLVAENASCPATVAESTGDTLSVLNPVDCVPVGGSGWWGWKDVASCTVSGSVRCEYKLIEGPVADDSCASVSRSSSPDFTVEKPVECTDDGWTSFTDTNESCTKSSTVDCQYRWYDDWQDDATGTCAINKSSGSSFTVIDATDCRDHVGGFSGDLDTCTAVTTGPTRVQCRYKSGWTGYGEWGSSCTPKEDYDSGPIYNARIDCDRRAIGTTSIDVCATTIKDENNNDIPNPYYNNLYCTVCNNPSHPDYAESCTSDWRGWSDASSCTPSGNAGDPDAVRCRYQRKNDWTNKSPGDCTPRQDPGFSLTHEAVLPAGTYTMGQPRFCQVNFDAAVASWGDAASCDKSVVNNGENDIDCRYLDWTTPWAEGACPGGDKDRSPGPVYDVGLACGSKTDWTAWRELADSETCPSVNTGTLECSEPDGDSWENFPNADYPWDDFPNPPQNTGTTRYREEIVQDWTPALSSKPTAGAGNLDTASYGFNFASLKRDCTEGTDPATGVKTYCEAHVPGASGVLNYLDCIPQESTTSEYGVEVSCPSAVESGRTTVTGVNVCTKVPPTYPNYIETRCDPLGGTSTPDTLADVAEYYWKTDLRTPELGNCEVATGNVCTNTKTVPWQNMKTFTLGLGASGVMQFQAGYGGYTDPNMEPLANPVEGGDIYSITMGIAANAASGICSWQTVSGPCSWPKPASNQQTNIDDLWHAAINGRGTYFSAENPSAMATGISAALQEVLAKEGSRTPPTFDGNELKEDSAVFMAKFAAETWVGDLGKFKVDLEGSVKGETIWSAKSLLDARAYTDRTIYTFAEAEPGKLKPFTWSELDTDEQAMFTGLDSAKLSQLCVSLPGCLPPALHALAGGEALVNFLRGDRSNEGPGTDTAKYFRQRVSVLGDIVNSGPVYVQKPTKRYSDPGYGEFKVSMSTPTERAGMVYIGANDGMLHAFNAQTGAETWAFVPGIIMGDLYHLADKSYASKHRFFVDGTPVVSDVCVSGCDDKETAVWKTILVGGLNHGGRGYYALDVTDPAAPKGLWEFTDANLGYSYGNPVITKLADGQWVVMVTSGYNNADGQGHLFILNAQTGSKLKDLSTGAGSAAAPSGLAKIANFVNFPENNNLTLRVYGGDLLGNLWRFDVNDFLHPDDPDETDTDVQRLATLMSGAEDGDGEPQPITTAPQLGMINNRYAVVFVGTGQLLGNPDLTTTGMQSMYGIKDPLTALDYGDPRTTALGSFVEQVMGTGTCSESNAYCETGESIITITKNAVDWATKSGWYVDFPVAGERVVNNIDLRDSILAITTNTPQSGVCTPAGTSDLYFLDYATGGYIRDDIDGQARFGHTDSLGSDLTVVHDTNGGNTIVKGNDSGGAEINKPPESPIGTKVRRISWRELIVE